MAENAPNIGKNKQISEAYRTLNSHNYKRISSNHITLKVPEVHDTGKILKSAREKQQISNKGIHIRIIAYFFKQTLKEGRAWSEGFQALKGNNLQP